MAALTYFVTLVALVCSFAEPIPPRYTRTVSYEKEILVKCTDLDRMELNNLMVAEGIDVWKVRSDGTVDFRVSKDQFKHMDLPGCKEAGSIEDIVRRAERMAVKELANRTGAVEWFEEYHRYNEIVEWWRKLSEDNPQEVTFVESIGKSYEGRDQPAVTITSAVTEVNTIYFQCQIHAREWISGATCMYIANYLMENKENELVSVILNQVQFVFVPFVNPDGYEYTWTNDRLWRKNRKEGTPCYGVDLNRNYDDHWAGGGSSSNPCSETYHGPSAASEVETQNTANYFKSFNNIVGAIDWHSYSQLILRPYGWTIADSPDEEQLQRLGAEMSDDIRGIHNKIYANLKSIQLYMTTGTASDWFYSDNANENNKYRAAGFTIELRDTGEYGFRLPANQIIPTGEEMIPAVLRFAEQLNEKPLEK